MARTYNLNIRLNILVAIVDFRILNIAQKFKLVSYSGEKLQLGRDITQPIATYSEIQILVHLQFN